MAAKLRTIFCCYKFFSRKIKNIFQVKVFRFGEYKCMDYGEEDQYC